MTFVSPDGSRAVNGYSMVVIGASAGGFDALSALLTAIGKPFPIPILAVQHLHPTDGGSFAMHLAAATEARVVVPFDKESIHSGTVYLAPANYHMLVEENFTIALSIDPKVNFSRPSIDLLFESAAAAFGNSVIAVILSGASHDGARGMLAVRNAGGLSIVQDPAGADTPGMPKAAIDAGAASEVLDIPGIAGRLTRLVSESKAE